MQEFDVFDISYEGSGVAKDNNQIVFIPKTLPGEKVFAEIVKRNKNYSSAECKKIIKASPFRIDPKCPYFFECGGCSFQHCEYLQEKLFKIQILQKELSKVGFGGDVDFIPSENRFGYRNKVKFEVKNGMLGYFKPKSHNFFAVKKCPIVSPKLMCWTEKISQFIQENNFENCKSVYIKTLGNNIGICFLFSKKSKKHGKNVKNLNLFEKISVFFAYGNVLESDQTDIVCAQGKDKILQTVFGKNFECDIRAFNQVNDNVAEKLYQHIGNIVSDKNVVNAYSGQGLLTYIISSKAKFVYGIECQKSAHDSAKQFERTNIENVCGRVEDMLAGVLSKRLCDVIVLDPARNGCEKDVLKAIIDNKIPEIVYVSCNFSTLVRDIGILNQNYVIKSVKIFDMFPCTANMETVVEMHLE